MWTSYKRICGWMGFSAVHLWSFSLLMCMFIHVTHSVLEILNEHEILLKV